MKNNKTSAINNNVVKDVIENDVNDVIDNNVENDVNENVVVEKVINNDDDDYDYGNDYWAGRREIIIREREEERRLKYLRKSYNKTEVARLKSIVDNKKNNSDEFAFDVDIVENAKKAEKELWEFYGVRYNGNRLDLKKFNAFMKRQDALYCDLHGGVKADCIECNK